MVKEYDQRKSSLSFGPFHRRVGAHNAGEFEKVVLSNELWGKAAHTLAGGICVQAYPGHKEGPAFYSFKTPIKPKEKLGFPLNGPEIVRELYWTIELEGVEYRDKDTYVSIPVTDLKKG